MSVDQIAELREVFQLFDKDGDGSITVSELTDVLRAVGQNVGVDEVGRMVAAGDVDSNGVVDFPEFLTLAAERMNNAAESETDLVETFRFYDLNNTGFVTPSNLQFAMGRMGCKLSPEEADEMVREADLDGDGRLCYREFRRLMMSL